jgi:molecular chaperone GrpE
VTSADFQHEDRVDPQAADPVVESGESEEPQITAAPPPGGPDEPVTEDGRPEAGAPEAGPSEDASTDAAQDGAGDPAVALAEELARTQRGLVELTGDLQRLQAEYVNYKRRVDRDRELVRENARFAVLSELLPVLDDIDRARNAGELEGGFKAIADALERVVAGLGLAKFGQPGDAFDPNLHEALMHGHSADVTETTCSDIISAGYRIGDRVMRPARVTVVDPEQ